MDSSHLDQEEKSSPETSSDLSVSEDSPPTNGIFGEPLLHPRVGDEYQVEIPHLLSESEFLQGINYSSLAFSVGLAIPVMWVSNKPNQVKDERIESAVYVNAPSKNESLEPVSVVMRQDSSLEEEPIAKIDAHGKTSGSDLYFIVPGLPTDSWCVFETNWFLLGLYFFGKNLHQVSRFMDDKNMGQILSFYYGQFYRSPAYCKWSECRKMRNKKCVLGHRFFTGYRQQELFSRLSPHMSDESRTNLLEASRAFGDGRRSLDEYVSTLKDSVGIHVLVEAVGIGKGKDDLTTLVIDSSKNNQVFTHRPEIPSGKACSSLTCPEIVKFLTGDFRLSKARSNDLFWEAVWPRLLARGWHSEQPWGDGYAGSKNSLVFLMPGIKKFSRRKLTKGEHYFDSVSDVLAKVASEPELLELEIDETQLNISKEENGWAVEVNSDVVDDDQNPDDRERRCYLKPRASTGPSNHTKFTVVDTSLATEDNPCKVRELRSLPLEAKRSSKMSRRLRKSEVGSQCVSEILPNDVPISASVHAKGVLNDIGASQRNQKNNLDPPRMSVDVNFSSDHKQRAIKLKFSRRVKSGLSNCSGQEPKKRKLICDERCATYVLSLPAKKKKVAYRAMNKNSVPPKKNQPPTVAVATSTSNEKTLREGFSGNCVESECSHGKEAKLEKMEVIDLNLPQVPAEPEIDEDKVKVEQEQNDIQIHFDVVKSNDIARVSGFRKSKKTSKCSDVDKLKCREADLSSEPKVKVEEGQYEVEQRSLVLRPNEMTLDTDLVDESRENCATDKDRGTDQLPRRQSTRNRPLTTKALEALEIGFLKPVGTYRKRSPSTSLDQKSKRSRQPSNKSVIIPNIVVVEDRDIDGTHNEKPQIMGDPHIGSIAVKKEVTSSNPLRVSEFSCSGAP